MNFDLMKFDLMTLSLQKQVKTSLYFLLLKINKSAHNYLNHRFKLKFVGSKKSYTFLVSFIIFAKDTDISINIVNDLISNFVALLNASQPTTTKKQHSVTY